MITVSFTQSVFNVSEGAGTMKIGVTLSKTSPQEIILQLVITPITAEGNMHQLIVTHTCAHTHICMHMCTYAVGKFIAV